MLRSELQYYEYSDIQWIPFHVHNRSYGYGHLGAHTAACSWLLDLLLLLLTCSHVLMFWASPETSMRPSGRVRMVLVTKNSHHVDFRLFGASVAGHYIAGQKPVCWGSTSPRSHATPWSPAKVDARTSDTSPLSDWAQPQPNASNPAAREQTQPQYTTPCTA